MCSAPLGFPLLLSPCLSSNLPNLACTWASVHNTCFPPFFLFSPSLLLYLSLCLFRLKHLGKLANSKKKKKATNDSCLYRTYYAPERSHDLLLLFPSLQKPYDGEDTKAWICAQSCPDLWGLCSPPVHGIFQARILEGLAISYSRGISPTQGSTCISCYSCIGRRILSHCVTWEAEERILCVHPIPFPFSWNYMSQHPLLSSQVT